MLTPHQSPRRSCCRFGNGKACVISRAAVARRNGLLWMSFTPVDAGLPCDFSFEGQIDDESCVLIPLTI